MREISFRAWDEQCKEMHYDFEWISSGNKGNDWIIFKSNRQKLSKKPYPFDNPYFRQQYHIMQYTGLKDKNGVKVFEGDIIRVKEYDDTWGKREIFTKIVKWDEFGFTPWIDCSAKIDESYIYSSESKDIEVIGNKFQNPDLIKE